MQESFSARYLGQTKSIAERIDAQAIERLVSELKALRERGGRLFCLGSGGGAGHSSHATCDFRKLCNIEAYCPTDNVSELTARINDDGWQSSLSAYLKGSRLGPKDGILVLSVGGGDAARNISPNLVEAVSLARACGAKVFGIVGRDGGFTAKNCDACVLIPNVDDALVTPHTEAYQAVVWHLIVSHPHLQTQTAKWESQKK